MMTEFEKNLLSIALENWQVYQVIVLDWQDGPITGFCRMANPNCGFYFEMFGERFIKDDLDEKLFYIYEVLPRSILELEAHLASELGGLTAPVWIPKWGFANKSSERQADSMINALIEKSKKSNILVQTCDMIHFLGVWLKSK